MNRLHFTSFALCSLLVAACGGGSEDSGRQRSPAEESEPEVPTDSSPSPDTGNNGDDDGTAADDDGSIQEPDVMVGVPSPSEPGVGVPGEPGTGMLAEPEVPATPGPGAGMEPGVEEPEAGAEPEPVVPSEPEPVASTEPEPSAPVEPEPSFDPCSGLQCGATCDPSGGTNFLVAGDPLPGVGYCNAEGVCSPAYPTCDEAGDCTEMCPVDLICQLCDDGETCATPNVACAPDGGCGETTWTCPEEEPAVGCNCPVPEICQVCDDGSCATADTTCNPDGSCGEISWTCPDVAK
jgi:hypothetical protein